MAARVPRRSISVRLPNDLADEVAAIAGPVAHAITLNRILAMAIKHGLPAVRLELRSLIEAKGSNGVGAHSLTEDA